MIATNTNENPCWDLNRHEKIARILARELPGLSLGAEPLDIIDSIENLSSDMAHMPEVIKDCRLATEAFAELNQVIDHMYALADRAAELPESCHWERRSLDEEFKGYSHIVARLSGAGDYDGPSLSLASLPEAQAARTILGYLNEARCGFTRKLADQRRQINQAMNEALALLAKIVYETDELSHYNRERLGHILDQLAAFAEPADSGPAESQPRPIHFH